MVALVQNNTNIFSACKICFMNNCIYDRSIFQVMKDVLFPHLSCISANYIQIIRISGSVRKNLKIFPQITCGMRVLQLEKTHWEVLCLNSVNKPNFRNVTQTIVLEQRA